MNKLISRGMSIAAFVLASSFSPAFAQDAPLSPPDTVADAAVGAATNTPAPAPVVLSGTASSRRAAWQEHLTLGAGDVVTLALFDTNHQPSEVWKEVVIGPDGRINYLQARGIMAAGLTIDELRAKLDSSLEEAKVAFAPHTMITPVAINSKKYLVLGAVVKKGVFTLDRPLTIMEAIAQAGGLETGVFERNTVEMADLSHSFMVRGGKQLPIDFEKLFQHGDLSQNVALEPNDYLYFASTGANEIYVFGEVPIPGIVPFTPSSTVIGAITTRGGFTPRSYRQRVLVIRGSLNNPETFVIDTADILKAKTGNFRLQPRDIIFVAIKPWQFAQDLLDQATRDFITSVTVTYTGAYVGPFFDPFLK
jgi:protein involved in polysaccharide export with SLBB domain